MRKLIIYDGVRYLLSSSTEEAVGEFHRQLPSIKADIAAMRATQLVDQKSFHRMGNWDIKEQFGITTVVFNSKITKKGDKNKLTEEYESVSYEYVLLVELGVDPSGGLYLPKGFAIFEPDGDGEGPNGLGAVNLRLAGWTNKVTENKDPLGLVGQTTYREGWCKSDTVEQVKRVDGGYLAYAGDEVEEEVTECYFSNNVWTYEGIDFPTHWLSVTPGPPDPAFCGYTWAIPQNYGGPGGADYYDIRHLFYRVETGGKISDMWPPECNQYIDRHQEWHVEGCVYKAPDAYNEAWDFADQVGLDVGLAEIIFPNSFTKATVLVNDSIRVWGNVYGNDIYPPEDIVINEFPFTSYSIVPDTYSQTAVSEYARNFSDYYGVYVKISDEGIPESFIQGLTRWDEGTKIQSIDSYRYYLREEIDIAARFHSMYIPTMTARQLELFAGNEAATSDWLPPDYYTGLSYIEDYDYYYADAPDIMINCAGDEYTVKKSAYGYIFYDYGIFTKKGTGIKDGVVDPDNISPIYAYAADVSDTAQCGMAYGMILDGKHYRTDEFLSARSDEVIVPGLEDAKDVSGNTIFAGECVRVGIRKRVTKVSREIEYATE